ncbi:tetratricopeptide repeat protein [Roseisolibacter sp. H3M3-2]|uniref:tetratricopeptide repeat protein n=1 Tax=Roseisolibacter sp. H3M3-2 TaxID=3031323 RepID=UPI0023DC8C26|nr:tetratricopeptide repeat protein [Roseisolibacter sp. H3M3-2]MDF1504754.1 tetratricopeptide repeat protein [Roseisolibacter sp. H3M3-2]
MPLKARYCQALTALAAGVVASAPLAAVAQQRGPADPNAPRLMVGVFRSADKASGVQAADAIRTRISQDFTAKQLWVLPKNDIVANLEASGFPTNEALAAHDARALAQILRADEYLVGNVVRDSAGQRVDAFLVLTRDNKLVQPLGSFRVDKADKAAGAVTNEFKAAQRAFDDVRTCENSARQSQYPAAIAAARKGIAEYPKSTLARLCLAAAMQASKAPAEEVLKVAQEVIAIDPRSKPALTIAYEAYKGQNNVEKADETLLALVAADPSDQRLLEQIANEWAGSGKASKAVPVVEQLVRDNPGDPNFLQLQMQVLFAAGNLKQGLAAGEELLKADTAAATARLFTRLTAAAIADSQPQKASQLAAQGVQKFPNDGDLLATYADALVKSGQSQQAMEVLNKALAANPKAPGARMALARLQAESGNDAQALESLKAAAAAGDSAATVARYALSIGQTAYRAANASKKVEDFEKAIRFLEFANTTSSTPEGQFLLGATAFSLGGQQLQQAQQLSKGSAAQKAEGCTVSKAAQANFLTAQSNLPAGGKFNPQATQQLLQQLTQFSPYADQFVKALCR